jgi:cell wall-associated NlpC family hydrolase
MSLWLALRRQRVAAPTGLGMAALVSAVAITAGGAGSEPAAEPAAQTAEVLPGEEPGDFNLRPRPRVVQLSGAGAEPSKRGEQQGDAPSPGVQSDAEVRKELRAARGQLKSFKRHLKSNDAFLHTGPRARVLPDGTAVAPDASPEVVKQVILAGNQIAKFPYKWGGGHGAWRDSGYDCSGSVSFALAGAGLLDRPLASGAFAGWGAGGPGQWITVYANSGHVFMVVAGLRFDTSGRGRAGTRWQPSLRSAGGSAVRHPPGL